MKRPTSQWQLQEQVAVEAEGHSTRRSRTRSETRGDSKESKTSGKIRRVKTTKRIGLQRKMKVMFRQLPTPSSMTLQARSICLQTSLMTSYSSLASSSVRAKSKESRMRKLAKKEKPRSRTMTTSSSRSVSSLTQSPSQSASRRAAIDSKGRLHSSMSTPSSKLSSQKRIGTDDCSTQPNNKNYRY